MLRHRRKCEGTFHLQCQLCGQQFSRRDYYNTHVRTKHGRFELPIGGAVAGRAFHEADVAVSRDLGIPLLCDAAAGVPSSGDAATDRHLGIPTSSDAGAGREFGVAVLADDACADSDKEFGVLTSSGHADPGEDVAAPTAVDASRGSDEH